MEELGGMIFMQDPMDAHPHQVDIDCLNRLSHVHDVLVATNPCSAYALTAVFRLALRKGKKGMIASFFQTEYSPSVAEFKRRQEGIIESQNLKPNEEFIPLSSDVVPSKLTEMEEKTNDVDSDTLKEIISSRSKLMKKGLSMSILCLKEESAPYRHMSSKSSGLSSKLGISGELNELEELKDDFLEEEEVVTSVKDIEFYCKFMPEEMRSLALIAHNHMIPEMKNFIENNKNLLRKFSLTGSGAVMKILHDIYGDDPMIMYGPSCQIGALGGDAQLCALMCMEELGGIVFFQDPMHAHPHQSDIDCLNRQSNVHDIYVANNPHSAYAMMTVLRRSLKKGCKARISSFFETRMSPSVAEYKKRQKAVLDANILKAVATSATATPMVATAATATPMVATVPVVVGSVHEDFSTNRKKSFFRRKKRGN